MVRLLIGLNQSVKLHEIKSEQTALLGRRKILSVKTEFMNP